MHAGFVDAGFLRAQAQRASAGSVHGSRVEPAACVRWLEGFGVARDRASRLLRVYWYAAASPRSEDGYAEELAYHRAIGRIPKLTLRLGALVRPRQPWQGELRAALNTLGIDRDEFERHMSLGPVPVQKGVDVLLAIDLVLLAARGGIDSAVVIAGDADLVPACERARAEGIRVVLATPAGAGKVRRSSARARLRRAA